MLLGAAALVAGFLGHAFLAVEGPEEVDGGGAAGGEVGGDFVEAFVEVGEVFGGVVADAEVDAEGGGDADGGCAADDEALDGVPALSLVGDVDVDRLEGEPGLIEEAEGGAGPGEGLEHGGILGAGWGDGEASGGDRSRVGLRAGFGGIDGIPCDAIRGGRTAQLEEHVILSKTWSLRLRARTVVWAVCAVGVLGERHRGGGAEGTGGAGCAVVQEINKTVEALPKYSVRGQLDPRHRQQMLREVGPGLRRALELLGQLEAADRTRATAWRAERMLFLARLAFWGDPDAKTTLTDLSNGGVAADAMLGKVGLMMCRWLESGDADVQKGIVAEFTALAKANPKDEVLVPAALEMARYQSALDENGTLLRDVVERDLTSPAAERYKHQAYKVGRPFKVTVGTLNGKSVSTTAWRGKVVLIDFWATWCPPCMEALPKLVKLYQDNHEKGLEVLGISNDSSLPTLKEFLAVHKEMPWPESFGPSGREGWHSLSPQMGVTGIPTQFLIDRNGVLRYIEKGSVEDLVKALLDEPVKPEVAAAKAETGPAEAAGVGSACRGGGGAGSE